MILGGWKPGPDGQDVMEAYEVLPSWEDIRAQRNTLLQESDWSQNLDVKLSDSEKAAWAIYRQALRDVTINFSTPASVVWPASPKEERTWLI